MPTAMLPPPTRAPPHRRHHRMRQESRRLGRLVLLLTRRTAHGAVDLCTSPSRRPCCCATPWLQRPMLTPRWHSARAATPGASAHAGMALHRACAGVLAAKVGRRRAALLNAAAAAAARPAWLRIDAVRSCRRCRAVERKLGSHLVWHYSQLAQKQFISNTQQRAALGGNQTCMQATSNNPPFKNPRDPFVVVSCVRAGLTCRVAHSPALEGNPQAEQTTYLLVASRTPR